MAEGAIESTLHASRQAAVQYQHWQVFAKLLKQANTSVDILCAVYSKRRNELLFPGSNLGPALATLTEPGKLSSFLRKHSPDPLGDDRFAGGVACRLIMSAAPQWVDSLLLAPMDEPSSVRRARFQPSRPDGLDEIAMSASPLEWPDDFRRFVSTTFGGTRVWFGAFPLFLQGAGTSAEVDHVALVYFSPPDGGEGTANLVNWLPSLRDLLLFAALTHLSEQLAIQEQRLRRLQTAEERLGLTKINPSQEGASLVGQARRLIELRGAAKCERLLFPPVKIQSESEPVFYVMPKYDLPSLRRLLLGPTQPAQKDVGCILSRLVESLGEELYLPTRVGAESKSDWGIRVTNARFGRWPELIKLLTRIEEGAPVALPSRVVIRKMQEAHRLLRHLFEGKLQSPLTVFDEAFTPEPYPVSHRAIDVAALGLKTRLRCPFLCAIHGDLHFDNILVDSYFPEDPLFVLVDPRPDTANGDPAYDVGKLLFSCHAGYDFVDAGHFDLNILPPTPPLNRSFIHMKLPDLEFVYRDLQAGAIAAGLISTELTVPEATPRLYEEAVSALRTATNALAERLNDQNLADRAHFYEALFCLTLGSVHCIENPRGALALTLRGHQLLEAWLKGASAEQADST